MTILSGIRRMAAKLGIDVERLSNSNSHHGQALRLYDCSRSTRIFDVGANCGQYAAELLSIRPNLSVVSFEPLKDAHRALSTSARRNWRVAERMALGARSEEMDINVAGNSVSSSLLVMGEKHVLASPTSQNVGIERVKVHRLDEIIDSYADANDAIYLKVDTQGYEAQVLDGAKGCLGRIVALQLEMSLRPLYDGQILLTGLMERAADAGFVPFGFCNGFRDPASGELLQVDGYFMRLR